MTLLSVVKDVCAEVGVLIPTSVFSGITGNRTMQEMLSLANEMAQRIAYDTRDWTKLRSYATLTGDGVSEEFDLPANYKRMLLTTNLWRNTAMSVPMRFIPDADEWLKRRLTNTGSAWGEWTMSGGKIVLFPALTNVEMVKFAYIDKNCIKLASGGYGDTFLADNDTFILDERLLKLGMIWQWKAKKGTPYAEELGTYTDALAYAMGRDQPAPIIIGSPPSSRGWSNADFG